MRPKSAANRLCWPPQDVLQEDVVLIALKVFLSAVLLFGLTGPSSGRDIGRDSDGVSAKHRGACKSAKLAEARAASAPGAIRVPFKVRIAYFGP
jgi:hypothetical protein